MTQHISCTIGLKPTLIVKNLAYNFLFIKHHLSLNWISKFHSQVTAPWSAQDSLFYLAGSPTPTRSTVKQVATSCSITNPRNSCSRRRTSTWPCHGMLTSHPGSENSTLVLPGRSGWTRCQCYKELFFSLAGCEAK